MGSLLHVLGIDTTTGPFYAFWSGFGSDLGEFAIIAVVWHHLNCHQPGCKWPARHAMGGYCRKHRRKE